MSLHYLVKFLCAKIAVLSEWVKKTAMQDSATGNSCQKYPSTVTSIIWCTDENIYSQWPCHEPQNDRLCAPATVKKKDIVKKTFACMVSIHCVAEWWRQSVSQKCPIILISPRRSKADAVRTVPDHHMLDVWRVYLSAG